MAETTVQLETGFAVGQDRLTEAVLREATAGDIIEAQAESERVVQVPGPRGPEPQLVSSPSDCGVNVLRRQVVRLQGGKEPYQGPLSYNDMKRFTPTDLGLLQEAADEIDEAAAAESARREVGQRGRGDTDGGAD